MGRVEWTSNGDLVLTLSRREKYEIAVNLQLKTAMIHDDTISIVRKIENNNINICVQTEEIMANSNGQLIAYPMLEAKDAEVEQLTYKITAEDINKAIEAKLENSKKKQRKRKTRKINTFRQQLRSEAPDRLYKYIESKGGRCRLRYGANKGAGSSEEAIKERNEIIKGTGLFPGMIRGAVDTLLNQKRITIDQLTGRLYFYRIIDKPKSRDGPQTGKQVVSESPIIENTFSNNNIKVMGGPSKTAGGVEG